MEFSTGKRTEYVTIIAATTGDALTQFKAQGLDRQGYTISGQIGRHRISMVSEGGSADLFADRDMVAATFQRIVDAGTSTSSREDF